jgi:3-hydroxyisobutyrate dehydrogenase-like beta-hydroxyacid dehydrogenase
MTQKIGVLNPGQMGISVAASAKNGGNLVYWASEGRGPQTRERAEKQGLKEAPTLKALCEECNVIISVCPPHAAEAVAGQVLAHSFKGLYLDVNAISPQKSIRIGQKLTAAGVQFVDGGIIGLPAWKPGTTWLYLAGPQAEEAAALFSAGPLQAVPIGEAIGKASALKMCYAAYTKGSTALLGAILATAEATGVKAELEQQWSKDSSGLAQRAKGQVTGSAFKAWRWVGEMEEIAATFREAGLPGGFHDGAAEVFRRLAGFKDIETPPSVEAIIEALRSS